MENVLDAIDHGLSVTGRIVGQVRADQWSRPTVCAGWDVRAVTNHLVGGFTLMAGTLTTGRLAGDFDADWLGPNPVAAYDAAAQAVSTAWHRPTALQEPVALTFGTVPAQLAAIIHLTEVVVHGSDIAVAIGAEHMIDEELCAELLMTMQRIGIDDFRVPGIFGPAVAVDEQVPVHRHLMAFLGRSALPSSSLVGTTS
jgi:uncharacterized protein (TIGR03086 family)